MWDRFACCMSVRMRCENGACNGLRLEIAVFLTGRVVFMSFCISGSSEEAAQKFKVSWSRLSLRGISPVRAWRDSKEEPCCVRVAILSDWYWIELSLSERVLFKVL